MSCGIDCRHGLDLALLWLWWRSAAVAPIRPLAWEPPYTVGEVLQRQKTKKKKDLSDPEMVISRWKMFIINPREKQVESTMRNYFILTRTGKKYVYIGRKLGELKAHTLLWVMSEMEKIVLPFLMKLNIPWPYDPAISLLGTYAREMETRPKDLNTNVHRITHNS